MNFEMTKFLKNVREVAKRRKIKIGDLEMAAGVSQGYMSRTEKSASSLSMTFAVNVASILNCSIDFLIFGNAPVFTETELLVYNFLNKLKTKAISGDMQWQSSDEVYSAALLDGKMVYAVGAPIKAAWKKIKVWAEDVTEAPAAEADEADNNASTEADDIKKPQYVFFDEMTDKNPDIYRIARETLLAIQAAANSNVSPAAVKVMQEYLSQSDKKESASEEDAQ